jgi:hypothetical protein
MKVLLLVVVALYVLLSVSRILTQQPITGVGVVR